MSISDLFGKIGLRSNESILFEHLARKNIIVKRTLFRNESFTGFTDSETGVKYYLHSCRIGGKGIRLTSAFVDLTFELTGLDKPVTDHIGGMGDTREEALGVIAGQINIAVRCINAALDKKGYWKNPGNWEKHKELIIENSFDGRRHLYRIPENRTVYRIGTVADIKHDPFELVKNDLPMFLGNEKYYYVKLFIGQVRGTLICEAVINGKTVPELKPLLERAYSENDNRNFSLHESERMLIVQCDETYRP